MAQFSHFFLFSFFLVKLLPLFDVNICIICSLFYKFDVTAAVDFAKEITKVPAGLNGPDHTEGHDHTAQQEVSGGQGEDQEVGGGVELLEVGNGNDHNQVAQHGHYYGTDHDNIQGTGTQPRPRVSRA